MLRLIFSLSLNRYRNVKTNIIHLNSIIMKYLLTLALALSLGFSFAQTSFSNHSILENDSYSKKQIKQIKKLLNDTKHSLVDRLRHNKKGEAYSRAIMTDSYQFAKSYSSILNHDAVPFDILINSTTFVKCWAENDFESTGNCWVKHIKTIDDDQLAQLEK